MSTDAELLNWVSSLRLSKKCRNINRDFSDAYLMAELIHNFYPRMVDLHNYESTLKVERKIYNWNTLNTKTLKKLGIGIDSTSINNIANSSPGSIQKLLINFQDLINGKQPSNTNDSNNAGKSKKEKPKKPPPSMTKEENEEYINKIYEVRKQEDKIKALQMKCEILLDIMACKDAHIMKLMDKRFK